MSGALVIDGERSADGGVRSLRDLVTQETARLCDMVYKKRLRAVVLTGSVARDEGTFVGAGAGRTLLGDAEFFAVFHDGEMLPAGCDLRLVETRIQQRLQTLGLTASISVGAVHSRYLRAIKPSIFGYELRECGVVVSGDPGVLGVIPRFGVQDIPLEDGWRLLANRLVEQLEGFDELIDRRGSLSAQTHYRTIKLYLDMGTSLLLFTGGYAPTYRHRAEALLQLNTPPRSGGVQFPLHPFVADVVAATGWKLGATAAVQSEPRDFWERAMQHAERLWHWELGRLTGLPADRPARDLLRAWVQQQPLHARLRGWAHVARQQGLRSGLSRWPQWMRAAVKSSPRYRVYGVAAPLLFALHRAGTHGMDLARMQRRLPVARPDCQPDPRQLVTDVLDNYRQFLVGTRA